MIKEKKKYTVTIFGEQYVLVSDDAPERTMNVASQVDQLMQDIAEKTQINQTKKVAVLAALQIAEKLLAVESELKREKEKHEAIISKIDRECLSSF